MSTSAKSWFGLSGSQRPIFSLKFSSVMMSADAMFAVFANIQVSPEAAPGCYQQVKGGRYFGLSKDALVAIRPKANKDNQEIFALLTCEDGTRRQRRDSRTADG